MTELDVEAVAPMAGTKKLEEEEEDADDSWGDGFEPLPLVVAWECVACGWLVFARSGCPVRLWDCGWVSAFQKEGGRFLWAIGVDKSEGKRVIWDASQCSNEHQKRQLWWRAKYRVCGVTFISDPCIHGNMVMWFYFTTHSSSYLLAWLEVLGSFGSFNFI